MRRSIVGEEGFIAIEDSEASKDTVTMLAMFCLDKTSNKQLNCTFDEYKMAFSPSKYWNSNDVSADSNLAPDGSAERMAMNYGMELGGSGRLLTREEGQALKENAPDILWGSDVGAKEGWLNYWTSTATTTGAPLEAVYYVDGKPGTSSSHTLLQWGYGSSVARLSSCYNSF